MEAENKKCYFDEKKQKHVCEGVENLGSIFDNIILEKERVLGDQAID